MHSDTQSRALSIGLFVNLAIAVAACGGLPGSGGPPSRAPSAAPTSEASDLPAAQSASTGARFADAWLALVEAYDAQATEVMISNPLSEWDLVGDRLVALVEGAHQQLMTLPSPAELSEDVQALDAALTRTLAMLEAIEPHGPRTGQAEAFQRALDDWVEHVQPLAAAIREALGLPPVPPGDLQL